MIPPTTNTKYILLCLLVLHCVKRSTGGFTSSVSGTSSSTRALPVTTATTESTTERPLYQVPSGRKRNCGGTARRIGIGQYYFIQSPYRNRSSCNWRFQAPPNFLVKLTFVNFDVRPESASFKLIRVNRGKVVWNNPEVLLELSNDKSRFEYTFDSNLGGIVYRASSDDTTFTIMYHAVPASCGSQVIATSVAKEIRTPGFPRYSYKGDLNCTWTIASQVTGAPIHFVFTKLETTSNKDFVQVYDGSAHVSEHLLTENQVYVSNTDRMKILFSSIEHFNRKGFVASIHIEQVGTSSPFTTPKLPGRLNRCGNILRRIEVGRKYIIRTPKRRETSCRWRLQAAKGLFVKITFLEFEMGPGDGSLKVVSIPRYPYNWDSLKSLLSESEISAGQSFQYPSNIGGVIYQSESNALVSIQFEAVLHEGKCGFSDYAMNKSKSFRTPGFPNVVYKGEMNCTWNIRARGNNRVELILINLQLRSGDQLQIFDRKRIIYSKGPFIDDVGIQEQRRRFFSSTRRGFTVRFITGPGDSLAGFAGLYRQVRATSSVPTQSASTSTKTTTIASTSPTTVGSTTTTGSTTSASTTTTTKAATSTMRASSLTPTQSASTSTRTTTIASTSPTTVGSTTTTGSTTSASTTTTTKAATSTTFTTQSSTAVEALSLRCYQIIRSAIQGGESFVNVTTIQTCQTGSVCLISKIVTTISMETLPQPMTADAIYGSCVPRIAKETYGCNEIFAAAKSSFARIPNAEVTLEGCGLQYCETDLCNSGTDVVVSPVSPSPTSSGISSDILKCYSIVKSILPSSGVVTSETKFVSQCPPNHKCQLVRAKARSTVAGITVDVDVTQGNCVPLFQCSSYVCDQIDRIASSLGNNLTFTECEAFCCDEDLCNNDVVATTPLVDSETQTTTGQVLPSEKPTITPPVVPPTLQTTQVITEVVSHVLTSGPAVLPEIETTTKDSPDQVQCYSINRAYLPLTRTTLTDTKNITSCSPGVKCISATSIAKALISGYEVDVVINYGTCVPASLCNQDVCDYLSSMKVGQTLNVSFTDCESSCCDGDLCNDIERITTQRTVTTTAEDFRTRASMVPTLTATSADVSETVRCYTINKSIVISNQTTIFDTRNVTTCDAGFKCLSANAMATISVLGVDNEVSIQYGSCLPKMSCALNVCDVLSLADGFTDLDITFTSCNAACCEGDLCNGFLVPDITTSALPVHTEPVTESPTTRASVHDMLTCYQIRKVVLPESGIVITDENNQITCDGGYKCLFGNATAKAEVQGFQMNVLVTYGSCIAATSCTSEYCNTMSQSDLLPGVNIIDFSCNGFCCDGDLCNDGYTTTPYKHEVTTATSGLASDSRQCYRSIVSKINGFVTVNESATQTCTEGFTCVIVKIVGTAAVPEFSQQFSTEVISASCLFGEKPTGHNCTAILSTVAQDEVIPKFGFELKSCGIEYCDTDLCNNVKDIPTQIAATAVPPDSQLNFSRRRPGSNDTDTSQ